MKTIILILTLAFLCSFTAVKNTSIANNTFGEGERLEYLVYYGWLDGGRATLTLNKSKEQGRDVYHAIASIKTIGIASTFVPLEDRYDSFFEMNTGKPLRAIRDVKEGTYTDYCVTTFDHSKNIVTSSKKGKVEVPENIFDIVSAFYHARRFEFGNAKVGDTIRIKTYFTDELFPLDIIFKGKEKIKTKAGKFEALKFMPICEVGRVFRNEDDMTIYISNDENKIPLRMEFNMLLGSLKCDLVEFSGIKNKLAFDK